MLWHGEKYSFIVYVSQKNTSKTLTDEKVITWTGLDFPSDCPCLELLTLNEIHTLLLLWVIAVWNFKLA